MKEIVKRLMKNHRIDEMAYERNDAIDRCASLGKKFIEHFHKVYLGGLNDVDFSHHCAEMQNWYEDVRSIRLKSNKKLLTIMNLSDWFFSAGAGVEDFLYDPREVEAYDYFVDTLVTNDNVEESFNLILQEEL